VSVSVCLCAGVYVRERPSVRERDCPCAPWSRRAFSRVVCAIRQLGDGTPHAAAARVFRLARTNTLVSVAAVVVRHVVAGSAAVAHSCTPRASY